MSKFKKLQDGLEGCRAGNQTSIVRDEKSGSMVVVPVAMDVERDKSGRPRAYSLNISASEEVPGLGDVWQIGARGCLVRSDGNLVYVPGARVDDF